MLSKVISGGQTGVDAAALRAAATFGILTGGWCPRGWRTEDGPAPWLADFGLREMSTQSYQSRTRQNVVESDGTLLLVPRETLSGGTALTRDVCQRTSKPMHLVNLSARERLVPKVQDVLRWMQKHDIQTLNVAGPREGDCPGIGAMAEQFLHAVFEALGFKRQAQSLPE